jgi:hypothetical protein
MGAALTGGIFRRSLKSVYSDSLPRRVARVIFKFVKRQLIALIVILALGLQGSLVAFAAASASMPSDCASSAASQDTSQKSCCPKGLHPASCCLDACVATVAVAMSPATLIWYRRTAPALQFRTASFSSRGDSPLIRPPIL